MDPNPEVKRSEYDDDRCPNKWVKSCQECLRSLDLKEEKYNEFTKTYEKNLTALLKSLGWNMEGEEFNLGMEEYFQELSHLTGIDFPLCTDCLGKKKHELLSGSSKEKNVGYVLEHLIGAMTVQKMMDERKEANTPVHQEDEEHVPDAELSADDLEKQKIELSKKIHELRSKLATIERQKLQLEEEKTVLEAYRGRMNTVSAEISLRLGEEKAKRNQVSETVTDHKRQLELLLHCNAVNDAVNIWFSEHAITVNGVHMTGMAYPADWNAINAVLGDLALLVNMLYSLLGKPYNSGVVIIPHGAYSQIVDCSAMKSYNLYHNPRTDSRKLLTIALKLFFVAVCDLANHCCSRYNMELKYELNRETAIVGGHDFLSNDFDTWMKALRCLAVDIKQMVVYTHASTVLLSKPKSME